MIFCHYSRIIKMVPGGLGHVQKKLVIFVHHFPNLHTKSFIEDRVNRLHRHLRFENLQFQVKADSSLPYLRYLFSSCEPASYFAIFISMIFLLK